MVSPSQHHNPFGEAPRITRRGSSVLATLTRAAKGLAAKMKRPTTFETVVAWLVLLGFVLFVVLSIVSIVNGTYHLGGSGEGGGG